MSKARINDRQVKHIAMLSNLAISDDETTKLKDAFNETLAVIDNLRSLDTSGVEPTHQVTGLSNITRKDEVDEERVLTQKEALTNAKQTYHGYFVTKRVI